VTFVDKKKIIEYLVINFLIVPWKDLEADLWGWNDLDVQLWSYRTW